MIAILKEKLDGVQWCFVYFLIQRVVGSFISLYPGGTLKLNENKICSRIPLTIEPSTQSHFR